MSGFTKLFSSIVDSTIWREDDKTRIVWVTMLAKSDRAGRVMASIPGLADAARVSLEECLAAIGKLSSPDKWSRSTEHEGRRIETVDGGFRLLNYAKYRELRTGEERRIQVKEAVARHRAKAKPVINPVIKQGEVSQANPVKATVSHGKPIAEAEAEAEADKRSDSPRGALTRALIAAFCERWRAKYNSAYLVQKKDVGAVERLTLSPDAWKAMVDRYLTDISPFHAGRRHPLEHLANNPNEFTGPKTQPERANAATTQSVMVAAGSRFLDRHGGEK